MNKILSLTAIALLAVAANGAVAQTAPGHGQHHPGAAAPAQARPAAPAQGGTAGGQMPMGQMMQNMPQQCRAAMQNMPQGCMSAMQQMMQHGGAGHGAAAATLSEASQAYLEAMDKMHGPMMEGARAADADVAFIRGMIPHHQGAVDMARIVLRYGKDDQVKKLANDVIREQLREITEMEEWLRKHAR